MWLLLERGGEGGGVAGGRQRLRELLADAVEDEPVERGGLVHINLMRPRQRRQISRHRPRAVAAHQARRRRLFLDLQADSRVALLLEDEAGDLLHVRVKALGLINGRQPVL